MEDEKFVDAYQYLLYSQLKSGPAIVSFLLHVQSNVVIGLNIGSTEPIAWYRYTLSTFTYRIALKQDSANYGQYAVNGTNVTLESSFSN